MKLVPPGLDKQIRAAFKAIKNDISKQVIIYSVPDKRDCPNCIADFTGSSAGIYNSSFVTPVEIFGELVSPQAFTRRRCPVCSGVGYLTSDNNTCINAIVRWNPPSEMSDGELKQTSGGLEGRNVCRIKADKCYYGILRDALYVYVDGVKCEPHLPPVLRSVGSMDILVVAYFVTVGAGQSVDA